MHFQVLRSEHQGIIRAFSSTYIVQQFNEYSANSNTFQVQIKLEGCVVDERQFKTAKRSQAPDDATVLKRFFRDNLVISRRRPFFGTLQMPGHRLSRLAKGTDSESRLSIGTIRLGVKLFSVGCAQDSRMVP